MLLLRETDLSDQLDCIVIGAGVVGLAIGRSLGLAGREVVVLEAEPEIGMHTSSRNSEVIHAGLYYKEDSLKAGLCVRGRELLYKFCEDRHIPHERIGKLIVASRENEAERLNAIYAQAIKNGVADLIFVNEARIREIEPAVSCHTGLFSPSTGIVDSHSLMMSMLADIEASGGSVLTQSCVAGVGVLSNGFRISIEGAQETFDCKTIINAAGLWATEIASEIEHLDFVQTTPVHFAKGHYFAYQGKSPFKHLVYPIPTDGGLGVHATNDMGGSARFGPDVEWIDTIDYAFDESRKERFVESIKTFYPDLDESKLTPAYTGIRPKLSGPNSPARDFVIQGPAEHGVAGLVNLFGIESPGLTASLAIGEYVQGLIAASAS